MIETIIISLVYILTWAFLCHFLSGGMIWKDKHTFKHYLVFTLLITAIIAVGSQGEIFGL